VIYTGWECSEVGGDRECIQKFCKESSWKPSLKVANWNTKKEMGG
jgi:hypothetical protein